MDEASDNGWESGQSKKQLNSLLIHLRPLQKIGMENEKQLIQIEDIDKSVKIWGIEKLSVLEEASQGKRKGWRGGLGVASLV